MIKGNTQYIEYLRCTYYYVRLWANNLRLMVWFHSYDFLILYTLSLHFLHIISLNFYIALCCIADSM